jgi:3-hydroxybutyryl-CoA dehydrogenase
MRVLILGAGLMGAQIGAEYALGGHRVALVARDPDRAEERARHALASLERYGLVTAQEAARAAARLAASADPEPAGWDLVIESLPEDLGLKARLLEPFARASPAAILATNTSSLSVSALGERIGAPGRTLGTHYWNPPLLMPLVEVVRGERTDPELLEQVVGILRTLGKRPVLCRDVPGFIWNRLQMAVLREAVWLCENGVASPETVDEVLAHGLARRWRHVGLFSAIALGGIATWEQAARNLLPHLSSAAEISDLGRWVPRDRARLAEAADRRDRGLARDLREEREGNGNT